MKRSERYKEIVGIPPHADLSHEEGFRQVFSGDRSRVRRRFQKALDPRGGKKLEVEYRVILPDGSLRWVAAMGQAFFEGSDASRRSVRMLGVLRDITDQKRNEERVKEKGEWLLLLHEITRACNEGEASEEVLGLALKQICDRKSWSIGFAYRRDKDNRNEIVRSGVHCRADDGRHRRFLLPNRFSRFARGQDLPGRVLDRSKALWVNHLHEILVPERTRWAEEGGLKSAVAFPVLIGKEVTGILEFFSDKVVEPSEEALDLMSDIGSQLGSVLERKRLEGEFNETIWKEQQRLVQELHDGLGQEMTGLGFLSKSLTQKLMEKDPGQGAISEKICEGIQRVMEQVRALSRGLFPVEVSAEWLMAALKQLAENIHSSSGLDCRFQCDRPVLVDDFKIATHLHRIAQEAVTNAIKHSCCRTITIALGVEGGVLTLSVRDDGVGIEEEESRPRGTGLRIMRYRASLIGGKLEVEPIEGGGTHVACSVVLGDRGGLAAGDRSEAGDGS